MMIAGNAHIDMGGIFLVQAVVGGNWGDEGKGKMTDLLATDADIVVRYQGGANAGHTIINDYGKFALHLLPSGVFHQHVANVIGQGVALHLPTLFRELDELRQRGVPEPRLLISDRAQLVMPYHILLDQLEEKRLGDREFGSTQSGIAPFYADKYLKIGVQVADLFHPALLKEKIASACQVKNQELASAYNAPGIDADSIYRELLSFKNHLAPMVADTAQFLNEALAAGRKVLLEGQLGALKDPDNGIYPFTSSSSPLAGFAAVGAGIPPHAIQKNVTVVKAYSTCVGAGPFVTELSGSEAETLRRLGGDGGEYGATTGRPRRVGGFDAVATRYGCMLQGTTDVALTLLDVLGYLDKIPVCVAYKIDGKTTAQFPSTPDLGRAEPVYEFLDGWKCDIRSIRRYEDLPVNAKKYVEYIEALLGYPVRYISNGPSRDSIIIK
jgi:adenylosuccinate synthase